MTLSSQAALHPLLCTPSSVATPFPRNPELADDRHRHRCQCHIGKDISKLPAVPRRGASLSLLLFLSLIHLLLRRLGRSEWGIRRSWKFPGPESANDEEKAMSVFGARPKDSYPFFPAPALFSSFHPTLSGWFLFCCAPSPSSPQPAATFSTYFRYVAHSHSNSNVSILCLMIGRRPGVGGGARGCGRRACFYDNNTTPSPSSLTPIARPVDPIYAR